MATEQDWAAYADQNHLKAADTILARTAAGGGVEIPGSNILARRLDNEPFQAAGVIQGGFGAMQGTAGGTDWNAINAAIAGGGKDLFGAAASNRPPSGQVFHPFCFEYVSKDGSGSNMTQFAIPWSPGANLFFRVKNSGSWNAWQEVLASNTSGHFLPATNGTSNLGGSINRFAVVYAATGTINTSDERDKTWRSAMTDNEYAAALEIINELGFYQWDASIAEKGEDARYHFGVRAQRAFAILDDHLGEGAWHSYAFACYDSWDDQFAEVLDENDNIDAGAQGDPVTPAGDRYGLRTDQFTLFLMAAQARKQGELEQRIAALEA